MTVEELIEALLECNLKAEVYVDAVNSSGDYVTERVAKIGGNLKDEVFIRNMEA